ncbi:hypothetical protein BJ875DRAFT_175278 [Amylocarpus encephaloides]|uniref:Rhodopsin domain-containing protein n=1 Tax=Amylocarpus encephaloides TaxID=45428 RepID=A0A9P7YQB3_9HELO|nr:hypothetical protein BJ875DRAFT_175278 [Amylocarpus encephaloides]
MASTPKNTPLDADISKNALAAGICGIILSGLMCAGRVASRRIKKQSLDASDWTVVFGMICGWGICAMIIYATTQGMGRHIQSVAMTDPTLAGPQRILQGLIAVECLYVVSLGSIKISFLLLYRKIFPGKGFRILTNVLGAIIIAWAIAIFWISIFSCAPVSAFWTFSERPTAKCINTLQFYIGIWVPNIATDIIILGLPQSKIWKLQVGIKAKVGLALMFLTGSLVMVASIIRFTTLFEIDLNDSTWSISTLGVWTCVELMIAVASASMPVMRPLLQRFIPSSVQRALHTTKSGSNSTNNARSKITLSSSNGGGFGYGKKGLGSRRGQQGEEFERLPDDENKVQTFAMGHIDRDSDMERAVARDSKGRETIMVTKTWSMRSREEEVN